MDDKGVATPNHRDIVSKQEFGDCYLHVEFCEPMTGGGNSGVGMEGRYEIQILNSYGKKPQAHECGAFYSQTPPKVNASKPAGQWQTFDIFFRTPRFDDSGKLLEKARATVYQNGILIQEDQEFKGPTGIQYGQYKGEVPKGPIVLQGDHDRCSSATFGLCRRSIDPPARATRLAGGPGTLWVRRECGRAASGGPCFAWSPPGPLSCAHLHPRQITWPSCVERMRPSAAAMPSQTGGRHVQLAQHPAVLGVERRQAALRAGHVQRVAGEKHRGDGVLRRGEEDKGTVQAAPGPAAGFARGRRPCRPARRWSSRRTIRCRTSRRRPGGNRGGRPSAGPASSRRACCRGRRPAAARRAAPGHARFRSRGA